MLHIKADLLEGIKAHVESSADECCGFVFGYDNVDSRVITKIMAVTNAQQGDKRYSFKIAPKDYMFAERFAEQQYLQLLGVYHSHPQHSALPSEYDRLSALPYFSYIIVSVLNKTFDEMRSWRLTNDNRFKEEQIKITNSLSNF